MLCLDTQPAVHRIVQCQRTDHVRSIVQLPQLVCITLLCSIILASSLFKAHAMDDKLDPQFLYDGFESDAAEDVSNTEESTDAVLLSGRRISRQERKKQAQPEVDFSDAFERLFDLEREELSAEDGGTTKVRDTTTHHFDEAAAAAALPPLRGGVPVANAATPRTLGILPNDVLHCVFDQLYSQRYMKPCALVSRKFNDLALRRMYSTMTLRLSKQNVQKRYQSLTKDRQPGLRFVKKLHITLLGAMLPSKDKWMMALLARLDEGQLERFEYVCAQRSSFTRSLANHLR
jgi:hypothetical protein